MKKTPRSKKFQLNLVLLGDVGAGKATQSAYFAKKYGLFDFDMGRELTLLRDKDKRVENAQRKTADRGILTPTSIVRDINRKVITSISSNKGILFDGHPKMVGEAKLVKQLLEQTSRTKPLVLYITIPISETVQRIKERKGYLGTKIAKRSDDTVSGLSNRARYYKKNIKQVTEYFEQHYTFGRINGLGSRTDVRKRIQKAIDFYIKNYAEIYKTS